MKKAVCMCLVIVMALVALVGCSKAETETAAQSGKVVVNFEGVVTAVDGEKITLENGKIVLVSSDTVFSGDPDTGHGVSEEILVGNFIQGYTKDDPDADQISAHKLYCNEPARSGGKMVVNFEGKVTAVAGNRVTLENGQVVLIDEATVFSIASGVVEHVILSEGYQIQGHTGDNPAAQEISASRIHIIEY